MDREPEWRWWLAPIAWVSLAFAFAFAASPMAGLGVACVGFASLAWSRTRQVRTLMDLDARTEFDVPLEEPLRSAHQRLTNLRNQAAHWSQQVHAMRASWDLLPDGVIELDPAQRIVWANASAQHSLGIDRATQLGQPLSLVVALPEVLEALLGAFVAPLETRSPTNSARVLEVSANRNSEGGWLLVVRDVTDLRTLERVRRDFIANVAHELKTPLTAMSGFSETLESFSQLNSDEQRELVTHMQQQTHAMQRLVSDLLSLSRLESELRSATHAPVALFELVARCAQAATIAVPGQEPSRIRFDEIPTHVQLRGDASDLESALTNLLLNALRYTPNDRPVCVVWQLAQRHADLKVIDQGPGIAAVHIPRLTERFYRIDRGRSRSAGGTGLGLAIVKHIMVRHEGELLIESKLGHGSTFTLRFPTTRVVVA